MASFEEGRILLINKPYRWTSFDVVARIRVLLKNKAGIKKIKVGHAGTLDPLATGLLVLCTGKCTRMIPVLQEGEKEYTGNFVLGAVTPSYDLETEPCDFLPVAHITPGQIAAAANSFTGEIQQVPPVFSAVKIGGKRSYELARKGNEVELQARTITIRSFEITSYEAPRVFFRIACSRGTYIRAIARDLGEVLGCGAYLESLCRTSSGAHSLSEAMSIEEFAASLDGTGENSAPASS